MLRELIPELFSLFVRAGIGSNAFGEGIAWQ